MHLWSCTNKLSHFCKGRLIHIEYTAIMTSNSRHFAAQSEQNGKPWAAVSAVSFPQHNFYFGFTVLTPANNSDHDTYKDGTNENNSWDILSYSNGEKCSSTHKNLENITNEQRCFRQQIPALHLVWNETFDQTQTTFIYMYDYISQNLDSTKHSTPTNMFQIYSRAPISTDSASAVSSIRGLLWPKKNLKIK
jgi:hypothetical protein